MKKLSILTFVVCLSTNLMAQFSDWGSHVGPAEKYTCNAYINNELIHAIDFEKRWTKETELQWARRTQTGFFINLKTKEIDTSWEGQLMENWGNDPIVFFVGESEYKWVYPEDGSTGYSLDDLSLSVSIVFEEKGLSELNDFTKGPKYRKEKEVLSDEISFTPESVFSPSLEETFTFKIECKLDA